MARVKGGLGAKKRQKKPNSFYLKNKCLFSGTYFFNKTKEKQKKIA